MVEEDFKEEQSYIEQLKKNGKFSFFNEIM